MIDTPIRIRLREQVALRGKSSPFGEIAHLALQEIDRQHAEIIDLRGGLEHTNIKLREALRAAQKVGDSGTATLGHNAKSEPPAPLLAQVGSTDGLEV
jgi:hypothetical protein